MRRLGDLGRTLLGGAMQSAESRKQRIVGDVGDGSFAEYLKRQHPELSKIAPADMESFLSGSSDYLADEAEERLKLCARCDGAPARCASRTDQMLAIGFRPVWDREEGLAAVSCERWHDHRLRWKLERSGVPIAMLDRSFENFEPRNVLQVRALKAASEYVEHFRGGVQRSGLLILGSGFGVGKTHLAIAIFRELLIRGRVRKPMYVFVPEFLEGVRRSRDENSDSRNRVTVDKATRADLLVLDDLGAERTTDWVKEQLTIIFNARWAGGLATIVTTNAQVPRIRQAIGERALSRLFGNIAGTVMLQGEDRRRNG